jgi:hypothetical protein
VDVGRLHGRVGFECTIIDLHLSIIIN